MNTLFDKIWDAHVVTTVEDGPTRLYIDRLYCHEVTSPQAFADCVNVGSKCCVRKRYSVCPTIIHRHMIRTSRLKIRFLKTQVDTLTKKCQGFRIDALFRHDASKEWYYSRSRSRTWLDFAGYDDCVR